MAKTLYKLKGVDGTEAFEIIDNEDGTYSMELGNSLINTPSVTDLDATSLTLTAAANGNRVLTLSHTAAESTVTLPTATGSGNRYTLIVGAVNTNNHKIQVPDASHIIQGLALIDQDGGDSVVGFETAADSDTITLNGTTTGGAAVGDKIELIDMAANKYQVTATLTGSGVEATPFSAAVS